MNAAAAVHLHLRAAFSVNRLSRSGEQETGRNSNERAQVADGNCLSGGNQPTRRLAEACRNNLWITLYHNDGYPTMLLYMRFDPESRLSRLVDPI